MSRVITLKALKKRLRTLKAKRKKIVFTNGCFDILHYGHVAYLKKCKALGDVLVVGVNSDSSVRKIKGRGRPVNGQKERSFVLAALRDIDYVVVFNEETPERLIRAIAPSVLAKGGDWTKKNIVGSGFVESTGGKTFVIPFVKGFSTTGILGRIKNA